MDSRAQHERVARGVRAARKRRCLQPRRQWKHKAKRCRTLVRQVDSHVQVRSLAPEQVGRLLTAKRRIREEMRCLKARKACLSRVILCLSRREGKHKATRRCLSRHESKRPLTRVFTDPKRCTVPPPRPIRSTTARSRPSTAWYINHIEPQSEVIRANIAKNGTVSEQYKSAFLCGAAALWIEGTVVSESFTAPHLLRGDDRL